VAGADSTRSMLVRLDSLGNSVWTDLLDMGTSWGSCLYGVIQLDDGSFMAAGGNASDADGYAKPFLLRTTSDGHLIESPNVPSARPQSIVLKDCYPNPFNSSTRLSFDLPSAENVTLTLFDLAGRNVATLAQGNYTAGVHSVLFNAHDLASGTYFYRLQAGDFRDTRKMILLR